MRAIIFILILAVVALIFAFATGLLDLSQTREAKAPQISATTNGVTARGGQSPAFDVETGSVSLGVKPKEVPVPTVKVNRPSEANNQVANAAGNGG
jgi:hypothetical protein